jgi:hypothetical protein
VGQLPRASSFLAVIAVVVVMMGCGSGNSAVCVSNDVGEVCADNSDGSITFSGRGLHPDADVTIHSDQLGPTVIGVGADGTLAPGATGVVSLFADTEFVFAVWAVDANGDPFMGDIVITT